MNAKQAPELLSEFPVVLEIPVAWGEMDAMGHVNNAVYLRWFECARMEYFSRIGWEVPPRAGGPGPILAKTNCVFKLPISYPDSIWVGARCDSPETDRFTMHYRVVSKAHQAVAAEGEGRLICFDYATQSKAPLPASLRQTMLELEAGEYRANLES
jgi:acyl-CoA thioester hydrolase